MAKKATTKKRVTPKRTLGNQRLIKLAVFLEKLPPKRFDYGVWAGNNWKGKPDLSCGTTACALGWATTIPEFKKLGLRLRRDQYNDVEVVLGTRSAIRIDTEAAQRVFNLTATEASALFTARGITYAGDDVYTTTAAEDVLLPSCSFRVSPAFVAARIRSLVAWKEQGKHGSSSDE